MPKFTVSGRVPFDVQVEAATIEEAKKSWSLALATLSNPPLPHVPGLEMAFFTDEGTPDKLFVDDVTKELAELEEHQMSHQPRGGRD